MGCSSALSASSAERARADQEAVGVTLVGQTERAAQGARLRLGQAVDPVLEWAQRAGAGWRRAARPRTRSLSARSTRKPVAVSAACSSSAVLPMPASPRRTSAPLVPRRAASSSRPSPACSVSRPISMHRS